ncbi:MAG: hypothetical protein AAB403_16800 [Planctomycetota bacterium]
MSFSSASRPSSIKEADRRQKVGEPTGRDEMVLWIRGERPEIGRKDAERIYYDIPKPLRQQKQGRPKANKTAPKL